MFSAPDKRQTSASAEDKLSKILTTFPQARFSSKACFLESSLIFAATTYLLKFLIHTFHRSATLARFEYGSNLKGSSDPRCQFSIF